MSKKKKLKKIRKIVKTNKKYFDNQISQNATIPNKDIMHMMNKLSQICFDEKIIKDKSKK